jgi:hypothetical protein
MRINKAKKMVKMGKNIKENTKTKEEKRKK